MPRATPAVRPLVVRGAGDYNRRVRGPLYPPPPVNLLPDDQRDAIEAGLARRLDALLCGGDLADVGPVTRAVVDHVVHGGGKRVRPQLCLWACRAYGGDPTGPAAMDVACGWELFHAFLLVHDDLIDASASRRGRPSLHRKLASLDGDSATFGANLAIVAGDLLFAAAIRLWHGDDAQSDPLPTDVRRRLLSLFGRVSLQTGAGQAADVTFGHLSIESADESRVLAGYGAKTAAYTFEGPAVSGAILAGADADACRRLSAFSLALGKAYQLHNDLLDLARPAVVGGDLEQAKRTVTLLRGWASSDGDGRESMGRDLRVVESPGATEDRLAAAERLRRRLHDVGAIESTRRLVSDLVAEAREHADAPATRGLLDSLDRDYFQG